MSVHPPRRVRTFDGGACVYFYETSSTPPNADGVQGDWAVCLEPTGLLTFGPKMDETTWPSAAVNRGPAGPPGSAGAPGNFGTWSAATAYVSGQVATFGNSAYAANSAHTSSSGFRTDLASGKWTLLFSASQGRIETVDPGLVNGLSPSPTADVNYYFRASGAGAISKVGIEIGAQSGNLVVAAWANNGSQGRSASPATLLASSGSVACPPVGVTTISLGSTIGFADGDWLSLALDNTTATVRSVTVAGGIGTSIGRVGHELLTGLSLPTTPTPIWSPVLTVWLDGEA